MRHSCTASTVRVCRRLLHVSVRMCVGKSLTSESVTQCYTILNVSAACSNDELRDAYLSLVKKYHPDSISGHADADMFAQVEDAYRRILVGMLCVLLCALANWLMCCYSTVHDAS